MYRTILLATDGSASARRAAKAAVGLARSSRAKLVALNVRPTFSAMIAYGGPEFPIPYGKAEFDRDTRRASDRVLAAVQKLAKAGRVACRPVSVSDDNTADAIVRTAKRQRADLIVIGSHGRGRVAGLLLGSVTQRVLARCKIPVLVHR
jgi:nucleotide-binding universal stress UspA family protein